MLILAVLGIALAGCAGPDGSDTHRGESLESFTGRLDERIPELMDRYEVPGATIAIIDEAELVWSQAYGFADVESASPMTVESLSRTESISKPVTAWAVMSLVRDGEIDLDQPALSYIEDWDFPETPFAEERVTVRQLLSHTAGLPLGTIGVHYPPQGEMPSLEANLTSEANLVTQPGTAFLYSNVGFNVLELVIEGASGQDFAAYMKREVLDPLGMDHSTFDMSTSLARRVPTGYDLEGNSVPPYVYPEKASGGLLAPVEDVARFVAAGMAAPQDSATPVLDPESVEQLYTTTVRVSGHYQLVSESYGLGHFLETVSTGRLAVWHGGQGHGWMTHFHSIPETGDGIVILTNSQRSWPMIAGILGDWSEWTGSSPIGMTVITTATVILWTVISTLLAVVLWQLWRVGGGMFTRERRFAPTSGLGSGQRLIQAAASALLASMVVVGTALDFWEFFLIPIFPIAAAWLKASLLALVGVLILSAATPPDQLNRESRDKTPVSAYSSLPDLSCR